MRRILLPLLLLLSLSLPLSAQRSVASFAATGTFQTQFERDENTSMFGTAFCMPGKVGTLLTAAHAAGFGVWVNDSNGKAHEVKVVLKDDQRDIAVLQSIEPLCELNGFQWAAKNAAVGTPVWLYGWGGSRPKPILTTGIISSEVGVSNENTILQAAQLNALFGHSGGPVFNSANQIVGMLVGGFSVGDEMDVIVPVEVLRKVIK